ncbi:MAG: biotin/lipoyl-binding protein [Marinibacterium sp.]|nr:biotin/lipoyl-binding protein [Marinibacterium sp.]
MTVETPSGARVSIAQWSLAGLDWPDDAPECPATGTLSVPFQGVDIRFPVRLSQAGPGALVHLEGLSGRQRETLALFYRSLLSGRMASSADVITSLDTPVDLVPMDQSPEEQSQTPAARVPRALRAAFHVASYLAIAVAVVGIIGNNIFTNLDRIDVQHGRVVAPMIPSFPPAEGVVEEIAVAPGQHVREGEVMFRIHDPKAQAALERTQAELSVARHAQTRIADALAQLQAWSGSQDTAARIATALRYHAEFVQDGRFDDIRRQWLSLRDRSPDLAQSVDPLRIVVALLEAEARYRSASVQGLEATRNAQLQLIDSNHVRAPANGIVQGFTLRTGQPFSGSAQEVQFETDDPRLTIGWVSERFAETIYIGMPATIGLNAQGDRVTLRGAVADVRAGDNPERPGEFGIIVTIRATDLTADDTRTRLRIGAPVNLEAKRQLGLRLRSWFAGVTAMSGAIRGGA